MLNEIINDTYEVDNGVGDGLEVDNGDDGDEDGPVMVKKPYWARARTLLAEEEAEEIQDESEEENVAAHLSRRAPLANEHEVGPLSRKRLALKRARVTLSGRRERERDQAVKVPLLDDPLRVTNLKGIVSRRRDKTCVYDNLGSALQLIDSMNLTEGDFETL